MFAELGTGRDLHVRVRVGEDVGIGEGGGVSGSPTASARHIGPPHRRVTSTCRNGLPQWPAAMACRDDPLQ